MPFGHGRQSQQVGGPKFQQDMKDLERAPQAADHGLHPVDGADPSGSETANDSVLVARGALQAAP